MNSKRKIEVRACSGEDGHPYRALFVDGEQFDWGCNRQEMEYLVRLHGGDREKFRTHMGRDFLECLSAFLGRPVTFKELNDAIACGELNG